MIPKFVINKTKKKAIDSINAIDDKTISEIKSSTAKEFINQSKDIESMTIEEFRNYLIKKVS